MHSRRAGSERDAHVGVLALSGPTVDVTTLYVPTLNGLALNVLTCATLSLGMYLMRVLIP